MNSAKAFLKALSKHFESWIALAYLSAWGSQILLFGSKFWDDWVWTKTPLTEVIGFVTDLGKPLWIPEFIIINQTPVWVGHAIIFLANFLIAIGYYRIASNSGLLTSVEARAIGIAIALLPLYFGRVSLCLLPFTIAHLAFVFAWYLLDNPKTGKKSVLLTKIFSFALFFFSYTAESLICFYALPILVTYIKKRSDKKNYGLKNLFKEFWWLLLAPITFLIVRAIFMQPRGVYLTYNQIDLTSRRNIIFLVVTAMFLAIFTYLVTTNHIKANQGIKRNIGVLFFALMCLALAILPYFLVGKFKISGGLTTLLQLNDWNSRVHLLLFLPIAIVIAILVQIGMSNFPKMTAVGIGGLIVASVAMTNLSTLQYLADWQKQTQVITHFKQDQNIETSNVILIEDDTKYALNRKIRSYEYLGMINETYKTYDRTAILYSKEIADEFLQDASTIPITTMWLASDLKYPYNVVIVHIQVKKNKLVYSSKLLKR